MLGDGRNGLTDYAPYDAIHVGAAFGEIPLVVLEQLKIGGQLVCAEGFDDQNLVRVRSIGQLQLRSWDITNLPFAA